MDCLLCLLLLLLNIRLFFSGGVPSRSPYCRPRVSIENRSINGPQSHLDGRTDGPFI